MITALHCWLFFLLCCINKNLGFFPLAFPCVSIPVIIVLRILVPDLLPASSLAGHCWLISFGTRNFTSTGFNSNSKVNILHTIAIFLLYFFAASLDRLLSLILFRSKAFTRPTPPHRQACISSFSIMVLSCCSNTCCSIKHRLVRAQEWGLHPLRLQVICKGRSHDQLVHHCSAPLLLDRQGGSPTLAVGGRCLLCRDGSSCSPPPCNRLDLECCRICQQSR
mmetsp:Transcript_3026/g.4839  ORF Transcript_3026/g.4839 Transcript_3026/m.4839 type:complete len:222 (-) Transcript_3026:242-907(-)